MQLLSDLQLRSFAQEEFVSQSLAFCETEEEKWNATSSSLIASARALISLLRSLWKYHAIIKHEVVSSRAAAKLQCVMMRRAAELSSMDGERCAEFSPALDKVVDEIVSLSTAKKNSAAPLEQSRGVDTWVVLDGCR